MVFVLLFCISSIILKTKYSNFFIGFVIDKFSNMNTPTTEKRLIFTGGSNSIYSIDSELIEKELKIKVVNSGFVYNTGSDFQINFLEKFSREGDIVLYIPEFGYYSGKGKLGTDFLYNLLLMEPRFFSVIGSENLTFFFRKGFKTTILPIKNFLTNKKIDVPVKSSDFNAHGDLIHHLDKESMLKNVRSYPVVESLVIHKEFMDDIKRLENSLSVKRVKLYLTYPIYSKNFISNNVIHTADSLVNVDTRFIGELKNNLFEDNLFYDSPYHALKVARKIYTQNLIKYLKDVI
jgi:hypothetical protein